MLEIEFLRFYQNRHNLKLYIFLKIIKAFLDANVIYLAERILEMLIMYIFQCILEIQFLHFWGDSYNFKLYIFYNLAKIIKAFWIQIQSI